MKDDNKKILDGIINGDNEILKEFYSKHLPQVTNYVINNSGTESDAKDIFQDALVLAFEKVKNPDFQIHCAISTFVYSMCKKLWFNKLRKNNKAVKNNNLSFLSSHSVDTIIDDIDLGEKSALVQKYFMKLGTGCQEILLWYFKGYSMREIAEKKEFTLGYVRKRKFICYKKLINLMKKDPMFNELKGSSEN